MEHFGRFWAVRNTQLIAATAALALGHDPEASADFRIEPGKPGMLEAPDAKYCERSLRPQCDGVPAGCSAMSHDGII